MNDVAEKVPGVSDKPKRRRGAGRPFTPGDPRIYRAGDAKSKGRQFQIVVREWLEAGAEMSSEPGKSRVQCLLDLLWDKAMAGDRDSLTAAQLLLDRAYGKPQQAVELTGAGGAPVAITFGCAGPAANCEGAQD